MVAVERSRSLDIAKGIGIILVVWAHASGPGSNWIYQFHMPLFFLISGYLFNSCITVKEFTIRKIHSLYIPFVFWNLVMVFLRTIHNLIASVPTVPFTVKATVKTVLLLDKDNQFLGATWFLGALFFMSILYKICDAKLGKWQYKRIAITVFFVLMAVLGFSVNLPYFFSRTLILGMFFAFGVVVREWKETFKKLNHSIAALLCFALFLLIAMNNSADMGHNEYSSPILFVLGACMASYFTIWMSARIDRLSAHGVLWLRDGLSFLGKRSLDIVIWQFVFFRVVIAMQLLLGGHSLSTLLDYYPIYSATRGWWIAYTVIGTSLPILWCDLLRTGQWGRALKRIHAV